MREIFKTEYKNKLVKIFVPIMLSNLISQIQMVIDRIFLGRLDILYMSAVGNATAPMWTTMSFIFSLSTGASILISQSVGEKDIEKAKNYAASMVKFHNVIPILMFFFWLFCSPLVFQLMGVSENVKGLCVTYTRIYSPVFLILSIISEFVITVNRQVCRLCPLGAWIPAVISVSKILLSILLSENFLTLCLERIVRINSLSGFDVSFLCSHSFRTAFRSSFFIRFLGISFTRIISFGCLNVSSFPARK